MNCHANYNKNYGFKSMVRQFFFNNARLLLVCAKGDYCLVLGYTKEP